MPNKFIIFRNLAIFFIAGNMLNWMFPFPAIVWRIAMVLLVLYVVIFEGGKFLPCEKAVLLFVAFNLLHFLISFLWKNPSTTQIGNILFALLPLSLFVRLSEKGVMTKHFISIIVIVFLVVAILNYNHTQQRLALIMMANDDIDITNNASVAFLMLLPMLFLVKSNVLKWVSLMICVFYLVSSSKRGNIIAAIIPIGLFAYNALKDSRHSFFKTIIILMGIIGAALITYYWVATNEFLLYRMEKLYEGNSSGRNMIYVNAWHIWSNSNNIIVYLFGYGFDATVDYLYRGFHAHNDWLEILVDYGLLGILLYLIVFILLAIQTKKIKSKEIKLIVLSSILIWFLKSLWSMGFTSQTLSVMMISMGTVLGWYKTERNQA